MLDWLANGLVLAGIGILLIALVPLRGLARQIPEGPVRFRWQFMTALIGIFVLSYLGYAVVYWGRHGDWPALLVPAILFLGAGFVWLSARLFLQAAADIRRMVLLEKDSITDPLLGIYNRRYLDRRLEEECARSRRYGSSLFVLLLDIDHFKQINDVHGHPVGDRLLVHLGGLIRQAIRESDIAARYGGDELLIIAPHTTAASAVTLAERLRNTVETHPLALNGSAGQPHAVGLTVSIGVASLSGACVDGRALVENADKALYRAKQAGRNRVVAHEGTGAPDAA